MITHFAARRYSWIASLTLTAACGASPDSPSSVELAPAVPTTPKPPICTVDSTGPCTMPKPKPVPPSSVAPTPTPWLVLLCKPKDVLTEPKPISFYEKWLTAAGKGLGGAEDFFSDQSYGAITLSGSTVKGWYVIPKALVQLNAGFYMTRGARVTDCLDAARSAGSFPMSAYVGIIAVYNTAVDWGYAGSALLSNGVGGSQVYQLIVLSGDAYSDSGATHEMGHGYGLAHAHDDLGHDYGDDWTIMGTGLRTFAGPFGAIADCSTASVPFGPCDAGPSMTAFERDKLGWMPAARTHVGDPRTGEKVLLAPVNEPTKAGVLHLKVPVGAGDDYYSVDFKRRTGWDRNVLGDVVAVRKIQGGESYLQTKEGAHGVFLVGDVFQDVADNVRIEVLGIDANAAEVQVSGAISTGP